MILERDNAAGEPAPDFSAEVAAPAGDRPKAAPSLLEKEAIRIVQSLDDYEHVSAVDIGGTDPSGYWLVFRDYRFELDYEIASHCDYWDFVGALVDHTQYKALPVRKEVA